MAALQQAAMAPASAIRVSGLQAHYGTRQVLHDIDLDVRPGEIMVIMGGSGSGKSTLLRHLVGLSRPTAGRIELLGTDITRAGAMEMLKLRRRIGVAFQGGPLRSSMNVLDHIMLAKDGGAESGGPARDEDLVRWLIAAFRHRTAPSRVEWWIGRRDTARARLGHPIQTAARPRAGRRLRSAPD